MNKLKQVWANIRLSFWFLPFLIVLSSIFYAVALIETDSAWGDRWRVRWPWIFGVGAEAARDMLSTLAGSMMSVMGIAFSMTLLALTLASSQYTSRILWNFMRNRVTQVTLGTFAGIFVYCLIVMHAIRTGDMTFVPSLAVFFAFIMALGGIAALIFFIHHIAASIQASSIIASGKTGVSRLWSTGSAPSSCEMRRSYRARVEEQILKARKTLENRSTSNAEEAQGVAL